MESQHSQVSLFSGSDAGSSLELFSQPPPPTDSAISTSASAASCSAELTNSSKSNHGDTSSQPPMVSYRAMLCAMIDNCYLISAGWW